MNGEHQGPAKRDGAFAPYDRFWQSQNLGERGIHFPGRKSNRPQVTKKEGPPTNKGRPRQVSGNTGDPQSGTALMRRTSVFGRAKNLGERGIHFPVRKSNGPQVTKKEGLPEGSPSFLERVTRLELAIAPQKAGAFWGPRTSRIEKSAATPRIWVEVPSSSVPFRQQKTSPVFHDRRGCGASDEARTRYLHLGKVALYQMSYTRISKGYPITFTANCQALFLNFLTNFLPRPARSPPPAGGRCRDRG